MFSSEFCYVSQNFLMDNCFCNRNCFWLIFCKTYCNIQFILLLFPLTIFHWSSCCILAQCSSWSILNLLAKNGLNSNRNRQNNLAEHYLKLQSNLNVYLFINVYLFLTGPQSFVKQKWTIKSTKSLYQIMRFMNFWNSRPMTWQSNILTTGRNMLLPSN